MTINPEAVDLMGSLLGDIDRTLGGSVWRQHVQQSVSFGSEALGTGGSFETSHNVLISEPDALQQSPVTITPVDGSQVVALPAAQNDVVRVERDDARWQYVYHMRDGSSFSISDESLQALGGSGRIVGQSGDTQVLTPIPLPEQDPEPEPSPLRRDRHLQLD